MMRVSARDDRPWLGHHNISQTSTYLAASGDADAMRAFEVASGRLTKPDRVVSVEAADAVQSYFDASGDACPAAL